MKMRNKRFMNLVVSTGLKAFVVLGLSSIFIMVGSADKTFAADDCVPEYDMYANAVVVVKIEDSGGNLVTYLNDFTFDVTAYKTDNTVITPGTLGWPIRFVDANGGVTSHGSPGQQRQTKEFSVGGGRGNQCDPEGVGGGKVAAYAFRNGEQTPGNNGSWSLSCVGNEKIAFQFDIKKASTNLGSYDDNGGTWTADRFNWAPQTPTETLNHKNRVIKFVYRMNPAPVSSEWDVVPLLDQASTIASVGRSPVVYKYYGYAHLGTVSRNVRLSALTTWGDPNGNWDHTASTIYAANSWGAGQYRDVGGGLAAGGHLIYGGNYGDHGRRLCALGTVTPRGGSAPDSFMKYGAASTNAWGLGPGGGADSAYNFGSGVESIETTHKLCTTIFEEFETSPMVKLRVNGAEVGTEITNVGPGHLQTVERTVGPGSTVEWMRGINQMGPASVAGFGNIWGAHGGAFDTTDGGSPVPVVNNPGAYWLTGWEGTRTITQNDVGDGSRICGYQVADPWKGQLEGSNYVVYRPPSGNMSVYRRADACATIPYNYRILPIINIRDTEAEAETTVGTANVSVGFESTIPGLNPTKTRGTEWQVNTFVLPPGTMPTGQGESTTVPVSHYSYKAGSWKNVSSGTGKVFVPSTDETLANVESEIGNEPVGSRYCFVLSVKAARSDNAALWGHSMPSCAVIGIKPKLQVRGHDIKAGQKVNTGVSRLSGRTYGSFGEYAVTSGLGNKGMASGSGMVSGNVLASQESWSTLTFANTDPTSGLPRFGNYGTITPFVTNDNGAVVINGDTSIPAAGAFASPWGANTQRTLRVNGTLTITSDLLYNDGPYADINDIPRIVIIADDIIINANVKQIDPWIVADRIATCSDARDGADNFVSADRVRLDVNMCNEPLRFNGPVVANKLFPYRTTNAGSNTDIAAEIFNLRADAFLSSYAGGGLNVPIASTDIVTDLPPRF